MILVHEPIFRSAMRSDLGYCVKFFDSPEFYDANGDKWDKEDLSRYLDDGYFLVAEYNKKIVGAIFGEKLRDKGAIVWLLAVDDKYRDKGIGSGLLTEFEQNMKSKNAQWVILYSALRDSKTLKFYMKNGYFAGEKFVECLKIL